MFNKTFFSDSFHADFFETFKVFVRSLEITNYDFFLAESKSQATGRLFFNRVVGTFVGTREPRSSLILLDFVTKISVEENDFGFRWERVRMRYK